MTFALRRGPITAIVAVGLCATSCGRIGFDLLPSGSQQAVSTDAAIGAGGTRIDATAGSPNGGGPGGTNGGGGSGSGGRTSSGGTVTGGASGIAGSGGTTQDASAPDAAGGAQSGGAPGTGGAGGTATGGSSSGGASSGGTPGTGGRGPDAGPPPVCASTSGTLRVWSFNSTVESWAYWPNLGAGTLSWTGATGNPAAGSLAADVTNGDGVLGWIIFDAPAPNLTGHTGSVWVYLDSGSGGVKMYAQSNLSTFAWADGGFVTLSPRTWTCVTINFSTPVYKDATFDPANIVRFGIEVAGTGPVRVYADQFSY